MPTVWNSLERSQRFVIPFAMYDLQCQISYLCVPLMSWLNFLWLPTKLSRYYHQTHWRFSRRRTVNTLPRGRRDLLNILQRVASPIHLKFLVINKGLLIRHCRCRVRSFGWGFNVCAFKWRLKHIVFLTLLLPKSIHKHES